MSTQPLHSGAPETLYVGTHRRAHRDDPTDLAFGLYMFRRAIPAAVPTPAGTLETPQPGWIAAHPSGRYVYAVNEVRTFEGQDGGGVSAFAVAPITGQLRQLNSRRTPSMPCHCAVDATGHFLLVATFGGGTVHLFPINADGSLGPEADMHRHEGSSVHPRRQTQPHAHAVVLDRDNRFVLVPDLGTDEVRIYELETEHARLAPHPARTVTLPAGSGPRHLAFGATGGFAYLMNEMSATIAVFAYEPSTGTLDHRQTVDLLPPGFAGLRSGAAIAVHPRGHTLYATTRSHGSSGEPPVRGLDSLVWFDIDPEDGTLHSGGKTPSGGEIPRSFAFDSRAERLLVGHQASGTVVTFLLDRETGRPIITGETFETPVPVCLCLTTP
jgi:6-phosphogluconolactonase